jgi:hypothetical protein
MEASYNNTYPAIDLIPKDGDLATGTHDRPDKTAIYFCYERIQGRYLSLRQSATSVTQLNDMLAFKRDASAEMGPRFLGIMQTTWMRTDMFLHNYYMDPPPAAPNENTSWNCFRVVYGEIGKLQ